jgi:Protein of unknown function (DUF1488)
MSMSISSVGNPAWNTIRGVGFTMRTDQLFVQVLVTHDALDDIERHPSEVGGHLACFNRHRGAIEKVANAKYQRGQLEEGGLVIVQAGDLKPSSA